MLPIPTGSGSRRKGPLFRPEQRPFSLYLADSDCHEFSTYAAPNEESPYGSFSGRESF
jgi:hypothetical protein